MDKPLLSRLTTKGQATIPVEVRRALRLQAGDRVAFDIKNGKVTLKRADSLDAAVTAKDRTAASALLRRYLP